MAGTYTTGTKLYKPANLETGWATLVNANFDRLSERLVNVKSYGAVGDGVTDDTAAVQAAIDAGPAGIGLYFPATSASYLINKINIDARIGIFGDGRELTRIKAITGATGPLINWNNSTLRPGCTMRGLSIDMTNATGIQAVYMHNVRNGIVQDLYISPGGTIALQLDLAQAMGIKDVDVFNASTAAFKGSHASSSGNTFFNCFTDNTTTTGVYGFLFTEGIDWWCVGCRAFRAPGIAQTLRYGFAWDYPIVNDNATGRVLGCSIDAVSDGTSGSANVAGILFRKASNCSVDDTFISCAPVTDATSNTCIEIDDSDSIKVDGSYMSGQGVKWSGTASDRTTITETNRFYQPAFGSASMFNITTTPTRIDVGPCDTLAGSAVFPITNNTSAFFGALTRKAQSRWGLNLNRTPAATFETLDVSRPNANAFALVSGTLYLWAIYLPYGFKVANISWATGSTTYVNGTSPHYWVALYKNDKTLMAQSTDQTAPTIGTNSLITTALSSVQTIDVEGKYYIGVMVNSGGGAGVQPTISNWVGLSAIHNWTTVRSATADTGLGATAPNPAGATANIGQICYAYVT